MEALKGQTVLLTIVTGYYDYETETSYAGFGAIDDIVLTIFSEEPSEDGAPPRWPLPPLATPTPSPKPGGDEENIIFRRLAAWIQNTLANAAIWVQNARQSAANALEDAAEWVQRGMEEAVKVVRRLLGNPLILLLLLLFILVMSRYSLRRR